MIARELAILSAGFIAGIGGTVGAMILIAVAAWKDIRR